MDQKNHVVDIEDPHKPLKDKLAKVRQRPYNSRCCIYRVPARLRRVNKRAYTPQVVSIGPIHHGKSLKFMEEHKLRFLNDFLRRTNRELDHYIGIVKEMEEELRGCYEETFDKLSSEKFITIILVDAIFIVEVFLTTYAWPVEKEQKLNAKRVLTEVSEDFLLLENQLPFFILENIWNDAATNLSMIQAFYTFFNGGSECSERIASFPEKPVHFVDMVRKLYIPLHPKPTTKAEPFHAPKIDKCLDLVRKPRNLETSEVMERFHAPTVTQLSRAGVEFRKNESGSLLDISYSEGTLKIPKWTITDDTEVKFRNLLAFEQCHCDLDKHYICHYATVLMDYLINTPTDVDLLVNEGIIENLLGDSNHVSTMINKLGVGVIISRDAFYFADIFKVLNDNCRSSWNRSKANLKQNYFNTPWAFLSVLAAVILLILTIIQTVCSIISTA